VIFGQCYPSGEAPAIGRGAALDAGLPITVPGIQLDRRGSGLQATMYAAMQVQTGVSDLVIAGGAERMSQVEHLLESGFATAEDIDQGWCRAAPTRSDRWRSPTSSGSIP
jgi:acetyl-CoA C-acetyltransferase